MLDLDTALDQVVAVVGSGDGGDGAADGEENVQLRAEIAQLQSDLEAERSARAASEQEVLRLTKLLADLRA